MHRPSDVMLRSILSSSNSRVAPSQSPMKLDSQDPLGVYLDPSHRPPGEPFKFKLFATREDTRWVFIRNVCEEPWNRAPMQVIAPLSSMHDKMRHIGGYGEV
jgi:hypothetical protein